MTEGNAEQPTPVQLIAHADVSGEEVDVHKSLFYEQLQLYYASNNQRKLMGRDQLNNIINVVKGDLTYSKGDGKAATLHYKYKKDLKTLQLYHLVSTIH